MFFRESNQTKNGRTGGFTLIEAVISIGIFVLFASIVLLRYGDFQGSILLTNLAYDVALQIRQAQVYGIAVREGEDSVGTKTFKRAYGIHFDLATDTKYLAFSEPSSLGPGSDRKYDPADVNDINEREYNLNGGYLIKDLCVDVAAGTLCGADGVDIVDIVFVRPNLGALIYYKQGLTEGTATNAKIEFTSKSGGVRSVTVRASGQISVRE